MKIVEVNNCHILFDNGNEITYADGSCDNQDNYADFRQLDEMAMDIEFDEKLDFENSEYGFRFGNKNKIMFFVPCYSCQNGYYSPAVEIYYNDEYVTEVDGDLC